MKGGDNGSYPRTSYKLQLRALRNVLTPQGSVFDSFFPEMLRECLSTSHSGLRLKSTFIYGLQTKNIFHFLSSIYHYLRGLLLLIMSMCQPTDWSGYVFPYNCTHSTQCLVCTMCNLHVCVIGIRTHHLLVG